MSFANHAITLYVQVVGWFWIGPHCWLEPQYSECMLLANTVHVWQIDIEYHMWQSRVEIEHDSVTYFNRIIAIKAL